MKKGYTVCLLVVLIPILILCILIIPRTNTRNVEAVISSDYSTIIYKENVYVPIQLEKLPSEVKDLRMTTANDMIKATVENENYFHNLALNIAIK